MESKIEIILNEVLPGFWFKVEPWKGMGKSEYIAIKIAAKDFLINGVRGQRPQAVSLNLDLDTMELTPAMFGGNGGQSVYREPNLNDSKEKYLAMKRVKVPFRKPEGTEEAVLRAVQRFCIRYKETLKENIAVLCHRDVVNYESLLK